MGKKSSSTSKQRVPPEVDGVQVNFCKNPTCPNFGVPASAAKQPRGRNAASKNRDPYTVVGSGKGVPTIMCHQCNESPPLKSNLGIVEELKRVSAYLEPVAESSCPESSCSNHSVGVASNLSHYQGYGKTKSGSQRFICKECGKLFSVGKSTLRQR